MAIAFLNILIDSNNKSTYLNYSIYSVNYRIYLANLIRIIHYMGTIFIIGAWCLPYENCWYCNIIFVPTMFIQWHFSNMKCLLTIWEHNLRYPSNTKEKLNESSTSLIYLKDKVDTNPGFIEQIFTKITKIKTKGKIKTYLCKTMYIIPSISWGLCIYNVCKHTF